MKLNDVHPAIQGIFPNYHNGQWVSYTFRSIMLGLRDHGLDSYMHAFAADRQHNHELSTSLPGFAHKTLSKYNKGINESLMRRRVENKSKRGDILYHWLHSDRFSFSSKYFNAKEMINCPQVRRNQELALAYRRAGVPSPPFNKQDEQDELNRLSKMDLIFCPNPNVKESLINNGIKEESCALVSYGWSPERLEGDHTIISKSDDEVSFVFVGTFDIRKGAAEILDAWKLRSLKGKLIIAGSIDTLVRDLYKETLARDDVVCLGHVNDVGAVYRSGDVFVFPSWEEGGPLVTLEAMSQGLPCIVTDMGSSGAFEPKDSAGIFVRAGNVDDLVDAMDFFSKDATRAREFGTNARAIAETYTWDKVCQRRAEHFRKAFNLVG